MRSQFDPNCFRTPSQKWLALLLLEFWEGTAFSAACHWISFCHGSPQALKTLAITYKNIFFRITESIACLVFAFLHGTPNRLSVTWDQHSWLLIFLACLTGRIIRYLLVRWSSPIDFQPRDLQMKASDRTSAISGCQRLHCRQQFLYVSTGKYYHSYY